MTSSDNVLDWKSLDYSFQKAALKASPKFNKLGIICFSGFFNGGIGIIGQVSLSY